MSVFNSSALEEDTTKQQQSVDHVREYALAVTFYGLVDLCHRDYIREADGLGMMSMWRVNMLRFWSGNHYKYLNAGHRLLAGSYLIVHLFDLFD